MRAAKGGNNDDGASMAVYDDRTECPHCKRKFNDDVAKRHIPKCP